MISRAHLALTLVAALTGSSFSSAALADEVEVAQAAPPPTYAPAPPPPTYAPGPPPPVVYAPGGAAPPPGYAPYPYPPPHFEYPAKLDYEEGRPIPPYYHAESHARRGLVIGGAVTFGVLYLLSFTVANATSKDGRSHELDGLYVPGIGPFIAAANVHDSSGILLIDGFGQIAGLAMFISGFAFPKTELVRNDLATVRIIPRVSKDSSGISLMGTF